ncbi:MAG: hypothetical protein BRD34_01580, partial [Bacteroidetes bacterium QH_6_64_77]
MLRSSYSNGSHWPGVTADLVPRAFTLPRTVNAEDISATYDNGVLTVT